MLSARYGLVEPGRELDPYDLALADLPASERRRWGEQVASGLERALGPLAGARFEVHAGAAYRRALEQPLRARGASLEAPLARLPLGRQLAWYRNRAAR